MQHKHSSLALLNNVPQEQLCNVGIHNNMEGKSGKEFYLHTTQSMLMLLTRLLLCHKGNNSDMNQELSTQIHIK